MKETEGKDMDWIHLAHNRVKRQAVTNMVMYIQVGRVTIQCHRKPASWRFKPNSTV
jgi:hypothetical protein